MAWVRVCQLVKHLINCHFYMQDTVDINFFSVLKLFYSHVFVVVDTVVVDLVVVAAAFTVTVNEIIRENLVFDFKYE